MKRLFILIFLLLPIYVFAENIDNYLVDNLSVSIIDEDATTARSKALAKAQRQVRY